ncbi:MAG TPA: glycosyltransferase family 2 protein [Candidatus Polarisedimenticolia bacterium]|nr:glycosyltransferase family 2 protein [Candidatus Polarisedimenticolia bacterium]
MIDRWVLGVSLLLLFHAYFGYGLAMRLWATLRPRPVLRRRVEPYVSVVLAAHDEAEAILPRLRNLLELDYPADRLEVLVGSDGSKDGTAWRARRLGDPRVQVFDFETRRGKPSVLNDLVARARGDVILFADARQRYERHALRALVAPFADARVGAVGGALYIGSIGGSIGGSLRSLGPGGGGALGVGAGAYRRLDDALRADESWVDSTVGLSGAIYAVRADLFEPLPADTILDDVLTPMRVSRKGFRAVFEPQARAFDRAPASAHEEFTRKVRTLAGNLQLLTRERWLLNPFANRLWFQTVSHKGLRLLGPLLLVLMLVASIRLAPGSPFAVLLFGQACFYAAAAAGFVLRDLPQAPRLLGFPYTFCLFNAAAAVAIGRFLLRRRVPVTWRKTALRPTPPVSG